MDGIGNGHFIFAIIFAVSFIAAMVWAYRKDLKGLGRHYRKVWLIILMVLVIYFIIFFLNRI